MTGPNRHQRRLASAKARRAVAQAKQSPVLSEDLIEARIMQRKFDQKTVEVIQLNALLQRSQALTAGVMLELGVDEVTVSPEVLEVLVSGAIAGFSRNATPDGGIEVKLNFAEGVDDDFDGSEEE